MKSSLNFKSFFCFQKLIFSLGLLSFSFLPLELGLNQKNASVVLAQVNIPSCQAPLAGEYLLLVNTPTVETQQRLANSVPREMSRIICSYNEEIVTRLGRLSTLDEADRWGQYVIEIVGLPAVIARPTQTVRTPVVEPPTGGTPPPIATVSNANPTNPPTSGYNPQALGQGYAVLVNYFNRPEVAGQLKDFLVRDVGLVAYLSRPYLLALYTSNITEANQLLTRLSRQGFWAVVVDSQGVMLLTPRVQYP
jgi:hypothetical protein